MSGATGDESISAEEEAAVSRILADAAGPLRVPDDVAVRLDDVLSDLVAERADGNPQDAAPAADELARRRRWPRLLLAAAAVVVVGYGVASVTGDSSLSGTADQATSSDSGAAVTRAEAGGSAGSTTARERSDSAAADSSSARESYAAEQRRSAGSAPEDGGGAATLGRFPPRLRSERLDVGVRRALRYLDADATGGLLLDDVEGAQCDAPDLAPGERFLPVLYDGTPAALVARSTRDAATQVTVWSCDGARLDRTTIEP